MITRWSDFISLAHYKDSLKDRELSTRVSKRKCVCVFTMNSNLLDDFHKCFLEFLILFIQSLSNMAIGERN